MSKPAYMTDDQIAGLDFKAVGEALNVKREALHQVFNDRELHEIPEDEALEVKNQNDEIGRLATRYDELGELDKAKQATINLKDYLARPDVSMFYPQNPIETKEAKIEDAGGLFLKSEAYERFEQTGDIAGSAQMPLSAMYPELKGLEFGDDGEFELKGLLGTDDSLTNVDTEYPIQNIRLPGIVGPVGERQLRVEALFPSAGMAGNAIPYMEETTTTDTVAEVTEGDQKPESALGFEEKSSPAQVVAGWLPATRQILSDHPAMRGYINGRLRYFTDRRVDLQLLVGNGTAPNLRGILNVVGIQTQAKAADPTPDAVYKAMTLVRAAATGYYVEPDNAVFHPNDWQEVRLLRTADGVYIWGNPSESGPERIWGLGVTQTTAITENTALVGSFGIGAMVFNRWGLTVRVAEQHSTDFTANQVTILAERRLAFPVFRPAAFCTVTGI